ncbi:hypothetical protein PIB30_035360 [Stylosanthes scabra]|uniref:Isopenicillin N synthase-like Fe(2+) 2OG dioxygenase domain-containing protein n=1 Tax=Stylosanthes scabra TaxID=79078 RepID=A0ABU6WB50_9FABA|nr:hypothetical protein [Stylosanthes scabra]
MEARSILVPCVQELAKQSLTTVPQQYVRPDEDPTTIISEPLPQLPVIDMTKLLSQHLKQSELHKLDHAGKERGFFQNAKDLLINCRDDLETHSAELEKLSMKILELMANALGFEANEIKEPFKEDGMWIPVKPLPNALIINMGDTLEMISNGVYRSIEQ